jgi:hypothetical protein
MSDSDLHLDCNGRPTMMSDEKRESKVSDARVCVTVSPPCCGTG